MSQKFSEYLLLWTVPIRPDGYMALNANMRNNENEQSRGKKCHSKPNDECQTCLLLCFLIMAVFRSVVYSY